MPRQITRSALSWLRETDGLAGDEGMRTLKKAYWERKRYDIVPKRYGVVAVINHCYPDPDEHAHEVGVNQHGIVHHCDCPAYTYNSGSSICKHMVAVALAIDDGELDLEALGAKEDVIVRAEP